MTGALALWGAIANSLADVDVHAGFVLAMLAFLGAGTVRAVARLGARKRRGARIWPFLLAAGPVGLVLLVAAAVAAGLIASILMKP